MAVFASLAGVLLAWYFGRKPGANLAFTELIPLGYFVNVDS